MVIVGGIADDEITREKLMRLGAAPILGDFISPIVLGSARLHGWRMKDVYADNGSGRNLWTEERLAAHRLPLRAASTHRAVVRTQRTWSAARNGREAQRVTQPTLLIWGDRDTAVPLRHGIHFLAEIPGSRLFVFRRCGHLPQEEYPQEFTELVAEFCRTESSNVNPKLDTSGAGFAAGVNKDVY
ncbi:MAG: alpha/beta hydrolase [Pyrinomonadaceae bacterium]